MSAWRNGSLSIMGAPNMDGFQRSSIFSRRGAAQRGKSMINIK